MKKLKILLATLLAVLAFSGVACSDEEELYKVTLMDGTTSIMEISKEKGEYLDDLPDAPSKDGYVFDGWFTDSEFTTPYTSDVLSTNITLYAKYSPAKFTVIFNVDGGEELAPLAVTYGQNYELPVPVKEGYTFVEWTLEGFTFPTTGVYEKTSAVRVTASWTINEYTVTYVSGETTLATEEVIHNKTAQGWNKPQSGYHVEGIYVDQAMTVLYENGKITSDTTLYVKVLPNAYKITINENGGVEIADVDVLFGSDYALTTPVREGYDFVKYTLANGSEFALSGKYQVVGDVAIIANWQIKEYAVTYKSATEPLGSENVEHGKSATGWTKTEAGYYVEGIYTDSEMTTLYDNEPITSATELFVKILPKTFKIIVNEMGGNQVDTTAIFGGAYTVSEPTREGFEFVKFVLFDGSDFTPQGTYNWTTDITVTAVWERLTDYHKTSILFYNGNEEIDGFTVVVDDGSAFSIPVTHVLSKTGYTFDGWFTDAELTTKFVDGTVINAEHADLDVVLYAGFTAKEFTITANLAGGTIEEESEYSVEVTFDGEYQLAEPVKEGYTFQGYTYNGKAFELNGTFTIANDIELVATWLINEYTVTYMNGSQILDTEEIVYNSFATGWDNPEAGYRVEGIYADEQMTEKFDFQTAVTKPITLYVKIVACTYSINIRLNGGNIDGDHDVDAILVDYLDNYSLVMPSREGYSFQGYKLNGEDFALEGKFEFTSDVTITAEWKSLVADADQAGEELFIKKNTYFKIRNNTDEEFTFVFLTGMEYSFANHLVNVANAGVSAQKISDSSFKAISTSSTFDLVLTRQEATGSITYSRKAMIVENVNTFNVGKDYLASWGNKTADTFRSDFINKKVEQNLAVGFSNFIPDVVITNLSHTALTLEQANLKVVVKVDGNEVYDYVFDSNGSISFGEGLVGRSAEITLTPIYDIYGATPIVFNVDINEGVNVYNDAELKASYSDIGVQKINILRNIVATVKATEVIQGKGGAVYGANTYYEGSAYMRSTFIDNDKLVINGNFFEVGANAKVIYEGGKEVGFESSLPIINNNEGYSYRNWSVDGTSGYYIANVQSGIFHYMNRNGDDDDSRKHNGQITFNDLRISGNMVGDPGLTVTKWYGDTFNNQPLLVKASTFNGIVMRGGSYNVNNTTITNTNIALFADGQVSTNNDADGNQTQAVHINLNEVRTNDNFANSLYLYSLCKADIKNCQFGKSTSAVFSIDDTPFPASETQLSPEISVDANTTFNNFIAGDEAYFVAYGMNQPALQLKAMIDNMVNPAAPDGSYPSPITILNNKDGIQMMNLILFVRAAGSSETGEWNQDFNKKPYVKVTGLYDFVLNGQNMSQTEATYISFNNADYTTSHHVPAGDGAAVANPNGYLIGYVEVFLKGKYS